MGLAFVLEFYTELKRRKKFFQVYQQYMLCPKFQNFLYQNSKPSMILHYL